MAQITLQFDYPVNQSLQEGDIIYYIAQGTSGGFDIGLDSQSIIEIGSVISITNVDNNNDTFPDVVNVLCNIANTTAAPTVDKDFIFFGKERSINEASIVGYYGEFKFANNSKQPAELFAAACDITESSK
tara:strand:+ start:14831 stop:15220 length:390 start_codon:yes stop_codon:yes gene_type:complete